jgi:hypothetical protein|tara:strand:- start:521 stop:1288 length:768 start_codon:yes stop_codon:yes gene_type:complete
MATVNLGNIKLNWKGAYNAGTAYIVDDVVSYNGSSYVCIQASTGNLPTNTTYWNQMSAKGTDGTDVGTTLTTQGDILYRDGSGLQRLGYGTSGHALVTKGSGQNPVWEAVGGSITPAFHAYANSNYTVASVTETIVPFNTETYDTDNAYNNSNYTFTVPSGKAGKYVIYGSTRKNNFSGTRYFAQVLCTGTTTKTILTAENPYNGDGYPYIPWFIVEPLVVGDSIKVQVYHNDSGNRTMIGDKESSYFGAYRLAD